MLYREVPKNGDKLSVLGYGYMRLPVRMQSINQELVGVAFGKKTEYLTRIVTIRLF